MMRGKDQAFHCFAPAVCDALIAVLTIGSWLWMMLFTKDEAFSSVGFESLKYYTVLSNLFVGLVFCACAVFRIFRRSAALPAFLQLLKLGSTSCVLITFTVVMTFLGPVFGYGFMFLKFNLIFHLIAPVLSCLSYMLFERRDRISLKKSLFGLIPTLLYGIVYLMNVLFNGVYGNDFYGFAAWGIGIGFMVFALILALNFAFLQLLRRFSLR